eukprot:COSAG06_NODE_2540_length_6706_cov_9.446647_5_plen_132_part_00
MTGHTAYSEHLPRQARDGQKEGKQKIPLFPFHKKGIFCVSQGRAAQCGRDSFRCENHFENRFIAHLPKMKPNDCFAKTGSGQTQIAESTRKTNAVGVCVFVCAKLCSIMCRRAVSPNLPQDQLNTDRSALR